MFNLVEPDEFTPEEIEVIDALIDIAEEEEGKKMANLVEPDDFSSEEIDIIDALIDAVSTTVKLITQDSCGIQKMSFDTFPF